MYHFGKSLIPHLDARPEPDPAIARLVADGANGIANGRGVRSWTEHDGQALIRPLAGTRPRGNDGLADQLAEDDLRSSVKELA